MSDQIDVNAIADTLNSKMDLDACNASSATKTTIVGWGEKDYASKVSVTTTVNGTFTCPKDGYIMIRIYGYPDVAKLYYDSSLNDLGSEHPYGAVVAGNLGTCIYEYKVQKNEVLTCKVSTGHTRSCAYIPCKGE